MGSWTPRLAGVQDQDFDFCSEISANQWDLQNGGCSAQGYGDWEQCMCCILHDLDYRMDMDLAGFGFEGPGPISFYNAELQLWLTEQYDRTV